MTSQFVDKEFKRMMFDPTKVPDGKNIFAIYKELGKHKVFKRSNGEGVDNGKLMKWIMLMYDQNSPYAMKYKDVLKRRVEAARDVGFDVVEGGNFEPPVEDFMKGKNETVNRKIVEYIRIHRSFKYSYFKGLENIYYNILLDVVGGDTKKTNDLKNTQVELEATLLELMNEDNNPFVQDMLLRYVEEERLELRPEDIALKMSKNENPIPYKEVF